MSISRRSQDSGQGGCEGNHRSEFGAGASLQQPGLAMSRAISEAGE